LLEFKNLTKTYPLEHGKRKVIFENISFAFPEGKNIALLGGNGAGKSTTLRLIAGSDIPDSGRIIRSKKLSWPLGFAGGFHSSLTGEENLRFVCRIYGADLKAVKAYVEDFAELGEYLYQPIKTYSSGMRARLAFGLSLAIQFDVYLIDELTGVGDPQFRKKSAEAFTELRKNANIIMASHSLSTLREYCDIALVLKDGHMHIYENLEDGIAAYQEGQGPSIAKAAKEVAGEETLKESPEFIRNLQFHYIREKSRIFHKESQPVILVDTKRKRTGNGSGIAEQEYFDDAAGINSYTFLENEKGEPASSGFYDLARNKGWVCAGIYLDGISFIANSIRDWWYDAEMNCYPEATKIYVIFLNAGREEQNIRVIKLWNAELQKLADELNIVLHISFVPPGLRKWHSIRNRLFNFNVQSQQEKFLINKATVVSLMGKAELDDELKIKAKLDTIQYQRSTEKPADVNSQADDFYGNWNYRIYPNG
jgi:capsular polysaccharide transport system ATP-binding protein